MAQSTKSDTRKPRPLTGWTHCCLHILDSITYFRVSALLNMKEHPRCGWTVLRANTCSSNQHSPSLAGNHDDSNHFATDTGTAWVSEVDARGVKGEPGGED